MFLFSPPISLFQEKPKRELPMQDFSCLMTCNDYWSRGFPWVSGICSLVPLRVKGAVKQDILKGRERHSTAMERQHVVDEPLIK